MSFFRNFALDLVVGKEVIISDMKSLEEGVASFLYLCFTCNLLNLEYPKGSGILCSLHYPPAPGGHAGQAWHQVHQLKDKLDKSDMGKTFSSACNAYCRGLGLVRPRREYLCDAVPIAVV